MKYLLTYIFISLLFLGLVLSCGTESVEDFDGNTYKTVQIGNQIWMAENLNVEHFRNGDPIPVAKTEKDWKLAGEKEQPVWGYYDNNPSNGENYGKLYNWYAVNDSRGLAPDGFHVSTEEDWEIMIDFLGGGVKEETHESFIYKLAGKKIKSTSGWSENGNGTNESGFNGLPGGFLNPLGFAGIGYHCGWWSSKEIDNKPLGFGLHYKADIVSSGYFEKYGGNYIRCVKD